MTLRITTVCLGNICRSPIAAAVLAEELGDLDVDVDSMGTSHWHVGDNADRRALAALSRAGYSLDHVARQASRESLVGSDLVLAMDADNQRELRRMGVDSVLIRTFDPTADDDAVPDPYYGGDDGFDDVVAMIRAAVPGVRARVLELGG